MALESQMAEQNLNQRLLHETRVREIEDLVTRRTIDKGHEERGLYLLDTTSNLASQEGWCDSIGSVEDIQAKLLKRQEAAAKRERAMAYALAHQWQAGSRQEAASMGFKPDKSNWGWNWLERWMAVRPWENRFLDINNRDGVHENGSAEGKNGTKTQFRTASRKPMSLNLHSNFSNQKTAAFHSDGSGSSSSRSPVVLATSSTVYGKPRPRLSSEEPTEEANSRPSGIGFRYYSNPKERPTQMDVQAKKRLSLPNSGLGEQTARRPSERLPTGHQMHKSSSRTGPNLMDDMI